MFATTCCKSATQCTLCMWHKPGHHLGEGQRGPLCRILPFLGIHKLMYKHTDLECSPQKIFNTQFLSPPLNKLLNEALQTRYTYYTTRNAISLVNIFTQSLWPKITFLLMKTLTSPYIAHCYCQELVMSLELCGRNTPPKHGSLLWPHLVWFIQVHTSVVPCTPAYSSLGLQGKLRRSLKLPHQSLG